MDVTLLAARALLAGVFALAGVTKLADRQGSRQAAVDFGVPAPLATPVGVLLPLAELSVAAALIPVTTATWGAAGALALLLVFVAAIAFNLARGREPECRCFGQLHSAPAGYPTLLRNGLLAALAGFVLWQGGSADAGPSVVGWLATLSAAQALFLGAGLVVLGLVAAQWWFLIHLLRQNGRLLVRIEALEAGLVAAGVASAPDGGQARVADFAWVWDDEAAAPMPDGDGTNRCNFPRHRPADYESGESWPAPAPPGPHATAMSAFDGTDPNGEWRLFVSDDSSGRVGFFTNRFQLQITTAAPPPPNTAPTITPLSPLRKVRTTRPLISARVSDAQTELSQANIQLFVDNRPKAAFAYSQATDTLTHRSTKLKAGRRHTVRIVANDGMLSTTRSWSFKVIQRR